jgi:hypothetical protein
LFGAPAKLRPTLPGATGRPGCADQRLVTGGRAMSAISLGSDGPHPKFDCLPFATERLVFCSERKAIGESTDMVARTKPRHERKLARLSVEVSRKL